MGTSSPRRFWRISTGINHNPSVSPSKLKRSIYPWHGRIRLRNRCDLVQIQDGKEYVLAYSSFSLTPEQQRYCTTRKELLAIVRFTKQFNHYLLGGRFTVRTDHSSLTWLLNFKNPQGHLASWLEVKSQYDMTVIHRPWKKHGNANPLSRLSDTKPRNYVDMDLSQVPCGGYKYCMRMHNVKRGQDLEMMWTT